MSRNTRFAGSIIGIAFIISVMVPLAQAMAATACTNISSLAQLQAMSLTGNYCLTADIPAKGANFTPIGDANHPFTASLDGQGHSIDQITINSSDRDVALIAYLGSGGSVSNLGITRLSITATIHNTCVLSGDAVGGLVGENQGMITNSDTEGSISGTAAGKCIGDLDVGGLAGANCGTISRSYSAASITGRSSQGASLGGLVGTNGLSFYGGPGTISQSFATGNVSGEGQAIIVLGGLVGYNDEIGVITESYAAGTVSQLRPSPNSTPRVCWWPGRTIGRQDPAVLGFGLGHR